MSADRRELPLREGPGASGLLDDDAAAALLPERPARAHKGTFGRLIVIAGSLDYAGAALLVAGAAARTGAGLVTLAVPASLQPVFAGRVVEVTTLGLPEREPGIVDPSAAAEALAQRPHEALVVGPGLRAGPATGELVARVLAGNGDGRASEGGGPVPAVVDAEALNALAARPGWWRGERRPAVFTPHPGEFGRLAAGDPELAEARPDGEDAERLAAATGAARRWGHVVVLKGARTVIASPDGAAVVAPFENPALASAGTGDVLAGAIGALLAQGLSPWDAARLGVYLHGLAGEAVREALGDAGTVASDLLVQLPLARRRLTAIRQRARRPLGFAAPLGERS
ncbi:MAG TPA: NAD(P)H-hydrate dehydratase [Candidatus Limnocylindrales bacterium]|nr:NAD(P)H-hydrate dehydratase [Candidatus Limnocylindrales bacterium]